MMILSRNLPAVIAFFNPDFAFLYNDRVFTTYLFYWVAGCYAGANYGKFKETLRNNRVLITIFFAVSALLNAFFSYYSFSGRRYVSYLEDVHMMYCVSAILFFFVLSLSFSSREALSGGGLISKFVKGVDKVSYTVYLSHILIIFVTDFILARLPETSILTNYLIRLTVVYTVSICGCLLWNKIFNEIKTHFRKARG